MVLFFLFMQASLLAQVSWNLVLHLLGAACAVGSSGFTLSTLGRTTQAALAGASGRPFLRQDPTYSDPAPQQGHTNTSQVLLFHTSVELPWSQAGGVRACVCACVRVCVCVSRSGWSLSLREELCSKGPRLSLGLQRSSSLGSLKVRSPWLLAAHRAGPRQSGQSQVGYILASLECRLVGLPTPVLSSANSCDPVETSNNAGRFSGHMANSGRATDALKVHCPLARGGASSRAWPPPIQVTKVERADMKALTYTYNSLVLQ